MPREPCISGTPRRESRSWRSPSRPGRHPWGTCFVRKGTGLATAGDDGTIRYWDVSDGTAVGQAVAAHESAVRRLVCDPDGTHLASSGEDGRVLLWRVGGTTPEAELLAVDDQGWLEGWWRELAFSPDGSRLAFTSSIRTGQSSLNLWQQEEDSVCEFPILGVVQDAGFSRGGSRVAAGGEDGRITVWDAETGAQIAEQQVGDEWGGSARRLQPRWRTPRAWWDGGTVRLWDGSSDSPVSDVLTQHSDQVSALAFSNDGTHLASGASDGTVQVLNTATQELVGQSFVYTNPLSGLSTTVESLAFSPDGSLLAVTGWRTIGVWDITREEWASPPLPGHSALISALAFHPHELLLASAGDDGVVRLWDIASGETIVEVPLGSTTLVTDLTFSADGALLAASQETGAITVWDLSRGTSVALGQLDLTDAFIMSLTFAPDGASLASLDTAGVVSGWNLVPAAWRQRACTVANRNLTREEWTTYIGDPESRTIAYHATCSDLPLPVETSAATPSSAGADAPVPRHPRPDRRGHDWWCRPVIVKAGSVP